MAKIILGFAGEMASGKGTAAKYVVEKYNAASFRMSDVLRDILDRMHLEQNRENIALISRTLRGGFGQDIMAHTIRKDAENSLAEMIVIEGVRRPEDLKYLKELTHFKFIYVDAAMEKRYERLVNRKENVGDETKTFEEFEKDHQLESELQIKNLKNHADLVIDNNGAPEELEKQIDKIINSIQK